MACRVLLVNPAYERPVSRGAGGIPILTRIWPPLEMANAAALLRNDLGDIEVKIVDANALNLGPEEVAKRAANSNIIVVSTSAIDRWQCPYLDISSAMSYATYLKKRFHDSRMVIIGPHGTERPDWLLNSFPEIDAIVRGEPELTLRELVEKTIAGDGVEGVLGVSYVQNGKIVNNPPRPFSSELDAFTVPAFDLLPMKEYEYALLGKPFSLVETSRGCPYPCAFCLKTMYGSNYRVKKLENVMKELQHLFYELDIPNIYFFDLEFTLIADRVKKLCKMIMEDGMDLRWTCQTRVDRVDRDLLRLMRKAGCELIHYGAESGNERTLEMMRKGITLQQIRDALKNSREEGILTTVFVLLGYPGETLEDMQLSIKLTKEVNPDFVSFHVATPYVGTEFYEAVKNELGGKVFPTAYESKDWTVKDIEMMRRKAFREFYFRIGYCKTALSLSRRLGVRGLTIGARMLISLAR